MQERELLGKFGVVEERAVAAAVVAATLVAAVKKMWYHCVYSDYSESRPAPVKYSQIFLLSPRDNLPNIEYKKKNNR